MSEVVTSCNRNASLDDLPLVVDLDGTLLRSDLLIETGFLWLRQHPLRFPALAGWLFQGKATLKRHLAESTDLDVTELPYDSNVLQFIDEQRATGRLIVLATASYQNLAEKIAAHLGVFDEVLASHGAINLAAATKTKVLVERFGERGFDYMGNSDADLAVFASARDAYVVNASGSVRRKAQQQGNVKAEFGSSAASWTN